MTDYRCKFCHKLLFKYEHADFSDFTVEIECPKCKTLNRLET